MGTGKTTVGSLLANSLKKKFIDMDEEIEKSSGKTIPEIFSSWGEGKFRILEKELLKNIVLLSDCVVSCGGGIITDEENISLMKKSGIIISLFAEADTIYARLKSAHNRPLLEVNNPKERIEHLLKMRRPYYEKADFKINTDNLKPQEVVLRIKKIVENGA